MKKRLQKKRTKRVHQKTAKVIQLLRRIQIDHHQERKMTQATHRRPKMDMIRIKKMQRAKKRTRHVKKKSKRKMAHLQRTMVNRNQRRRVKWVIPKVTRRIDQPWLNRLLGARNRLKRTNWCQRCDKDHRKTTLWRRASQVKKCEMLRRKVK